MDTLKSTPINLDAIKNILKEDKQMAINPKATAENKATESTEDKRAAMDAMLASAKADAEANDSNNLTSEFADNVMESISADEAEKAKEKEERRAKILQNNAFVESSLNQIVSKGSSEFTGAQKLYRAYCSKNMMVQGLIYEKGPKVNINCTSSYVKDSQGNYKLEDNANPTTLERDALQKKEITSELKEKYVQKEAKIKYNMTAPRTLVGGIIAMPTALKIPQNILNQPDFQAPTPEEVQNSSVVSIPVSFDALFYYAFSCCGSEIKEDMELFKNNPYYQKHLVNGKIKATLRLTTNKKSGSAKFGGNQTQPTLAFPVRGLAIKENVIPIKTFVSKTAAQLSLSEVDMIKTKLENALSKQEKGKQVTRYDILNNSFKSKIAKNSDGSYDLSFINDTAKLQQLDLVATDWGVKDYSGAKPQPVALSNYPMPVLTTATNKDGTKTRIVDVTHELGVDGYSLDDLAAEGYTAAAAAKANGVSEESILNIYKKYRDAKAAQRATTSETIRRKSRNLDSPEVQRALFDNVNTGDKTSFLGQTMNFGDLEGELNEITI